MFDGGIVYFRLFIIQKVEKRESTKKEQLAGHREIKLKELLYNHIADYSTVFFSIMAVDDYLSAGSATSINASKSNLKYTAAPLYPTAILRLQAGKVRGLSDCQLDACVASG